MARDLGVEATRLRCCRLGKEERKSGGRWSTSTWARRNMKRRQEHEVSQWIGNIPGGNSAEDQVRD